MRRTEAGMRAGIAALTDGEYHEEMEIEGIAESQTLALALAVTVRIEGSDLWADYTGTGPQVRRDYGYEQASVGGPSGVDPLRWCHPATSEWMCLRNGRPPGVGWSYVGVVAADR